MLHSEDHSDDRACNYDSTDAPQPIQPSQQRPERRAGLVPRIPLRAENVSLLSVDGNDVFPNNVHSRSQRVSSRDGAEAERGPEAQRPQRDQDDELAAHQEYEDAQRQRRDLNAGRVPADADGNDDRHDDEAEGEVPVEVVQRPRARAPERSARGRFPGEADRAQDEGVEAHDAEDGGEDGEDVGRFERGGVVDGEVAGEGEDAAREDDDGGLEGDSGGVAAQVEGDAGDGVFRSGQGCGGGLAAAVGFGFGCWGGGRHDRLVFLLRRAVR